MKKLLAAFAALALMSPAIAADLPTKAPVYAPLTYPVMGNGWIFGVLMEGGGSSVNASVPGVPAASLTTTTGAVGGEFGYMWKVRQNLAFATRFSAEVQNFNGNNAGLSVQGPARLNQDFVLYAPWQDVFAILPNLWNPFSSLSAFALPSGFTAKGNALAGLGFYATESDISTAFKGLQAGKVWQVNPGLIAETVQPISTGGAVRVFARWDFLANSKVFGQVPGGGTTVSTLGNYGARAGVAYDF